MDKKKGSHTDKRKGSKKGKRTGKSAAKGKGGQYTPKKKGPYVEQRKASKTEQKKESNTEQSKDSNTEQRKEPYVEKKKESNMEKRKELNAKNLNILFEDNHLIVVNKPAGYLVQGDDTGDTPLSESVKQYIKLKYKKTGDVYLGVIHRLDRPVSGAIIFARTSKALTRMNEMFKDKKIEKNYLAITKQRPKLLEGRLEGYLLKDSLKNRSKVYNQIGKKTKEAKLSITDYKYQGEIDGYILLKVMPITGRSHQIRAQLAHAGCPIVDDFKYGYPHSNHDGSIHLHCRSMSFKHPVKKEWMTVKAGLPKANFWRQFKELIKESERGERKRSFKLEDEGSG
ncbi:MAG: 23S rRNA pseudouridine1911/1915/1917 synthase, partial [Patescibacteria group bacterium]